MYHPDLRLVADTAALLISCLSNQCLHTEKKTMPKIEKKKISYVHTQISADKMLTCEPCVTFELVQRLESGRLVTDQAGHEIFCFIRYFCIDWELNNGEQRNKLHSPFEAKRSVNDGRGERDDELGEEADAAHGTRQSGTRTDRISVP